jgi:hypothetical protein
MNSQIDAHVQLPAAVRNASARSDQLHRQFVTGEPETPETPVQPASEQTFEKAPKQKVTTQGNDEDENGQSWKHRYLAMKGRFEQATGALQQMNTRMSEMEATMASMQRFNTPPELRAERLITDQEETDYGKDFLEVVGKKAKEEILPKFDSLESKVHELSQQLSKVSGHQTIDARQKLFNTLDTQLAELAGTQHQPGLS